MKGRLGKEFPRPLLSFSEFGVGASGLGGEALVIFIMGHTV
jgi:hypothetical protein